MEGQIGATRKVLAQQSVGVFVRAALPGRPRVTKIDIDLGGQCQALMIGELFASVPGQRNGTLRASARLLELIDAASEHVSLDASKHMLALNGYQPPAGPTALVNINIQAGYVIDLSDDPPAK